MIQPPELPALVSEVQRAAPSEVQLWLVGGVVRDLLLNRRLHDFDFVVAGDGLAAARTVADRLGAPYYPLDVERGVGRVVLTLADERITLDFASLRGADIAADLAARDFTINAMAIDIAAPETLVDPLRGRADLRAKVIRACGPDSLADDPVRAVRAVRLAAQLRFRLEAATRTAARAAAPALDRVSAERRRDEFIRCLGGPRAPAAVRALDALGLMPHLMPELAALKRGPDSTAWDRTLATLDRLQELLAVLHPVHDVDAASDLTLGLVSLRLGRHRAALGKHLASPISDERPLRWLLMLAGLLHLAASAEPRPVEKAAAPDVVRTRLAELRFSGDESRRTAAIIAAHSAALDLAQAGPVSRRSVYRYFRAWGPAGVEAILLALARFLGSFEVPPPAERWNALLDAASALLRGYFETPAEVVSPPPLLTGDDLMAALSLGPGPKIGELLEAVREAQAAGEVADREAALAYARAQPGTGRPPVAGDRDLPG